MKDDANRKEMNNLFPINKGFHIEWMVNKLGAIRLDIVLIIILYGRNDWKYEQYHKKYS